MIRQIEKKKKFKFEASEGIIFYLGFPGVDRNLAVLQQDITSDL